MLLRIRTVALLLGKALAESDMASEFSGSVGDSAQGLFLVCLVFYSRKLRLKVLQMCSVC